MLSNIIWYQNDSKIGQAICHGFTNSFFFSFFFFSFFFNSKHNSKTIKNKKIVSQNALTVTMWENIYCQELARLFVHEYVLFLIFTKWQEVLRRSVSKFNHNPMYKNEEWGLRQQWVDGPLVSLAGFFFFSFFFWRLKLP